MNWDKISELYESCLERPADEWRPWIEKHCTDEEIEQGVDALVLKMLKSAPRADAFFDSLHKNIEEDLAWEDEEILLKPDDRFGKFRVIKEIGHGGMARVYLCKRDDGQFEQTVAVKIMKVTGNVEFLKDKFRQEQQILARINHPNIAQLFDGGITSKGFPYIVMEYVEGLPIDEYCRKHKPSTEQIIRLFLQVCNAMQYAHNKLIVHHDIKPANILVNDQGNAKLLDFGISQIIYTQEKEIQQKEKNAFSGTPAYAAPEQFEGAAPSVASDIYKLGLVLFQLLTGKNYHQNGLSPVNPAEYLADEIKKAELFSQSGDAVQLRLREIDLVTLMGKCLANDPGERFASVSELSHDLQNMLANRPLHSVDATWSYLLMKGYLRNRAKVWMFVFFNIALLIAGGFLVSQFFQTLREKQRAEYLLGFVFDIFDSADPETTQGESVSVVELIERSIPRIDELAERPDFQAELYHVTGMLFTRMGEWDRGKELYLKSLAVLESLPQNSANQFNRAALLTDLAGYYRNTAKAAMADSIIDLAIAIYEKNHRQTKAVDFSKALIIKAHILRIQSQPEESMGYARQVLSILESHSVKDSWQKVTAKANLAAASKDLSRYEDAFSYTYQAMEMMDRLGDEINSTRIMLLENYATTLAQTGKVEEAIEVQNEILEMNRRLYGEDAPVTLITLLNKAANYYRLDEYAVSDSINLVVIDAYTRIFGPYSNYTLSAIYNLSSSYYSQEKFEKALELQYRVLEGDINNLGPSHPFVAGDHYSLGITYMSMENYAASERNLKEALAIYRENFPGKHHQTARTKGRLAELYCRMGDFARCNDYFHQALEMALEVVGEEHPTTLTIKRRMEHFGDVLHPL